MQGKRQFEITERIFITATNMLTMRIEPLVAEPDSNLIDTDNQSLGSLSNRNRVAQMIPMSMTNEDEIRLDSSRLDGSNGISIQEGVDNNFLSIRFKPQSRVSVPG